MCVIHVSVRVGFSSRRFEPIHEIGKSTPTYIFKMRTFTEQDLGEVKTLGNPPQLVKDMLTATCLLLGYTEQEAKDWRSVIKILSGRGKDSLKARCDAVQVDQIPLEAGLTAKKYLGDVTVEKMCKISMSASKICGWTTSVKLTNAVPTLAADQKPHRNLKMRTFSEGDITEVKSLPKPPQLVKDVLTATCLLLGYTEQEAKEWRIVQRIVSGKGKDSLKARCDAVQVDQIPLEAGLTAKKYLGDVTVEKMCKISRAASNICGWTIDVTEQVVQKVPVMKFL
nr:hypothetical protein BaRGS_014594 [Batillaria attramentaria]